MPLFQYCSDLHLEFPENLHHVSANPLKPIAPVLIMAGDIVPLDLLSRMGDFLSFVSGEFEQVFWVPGNHEYYRSDIARYPTPLSEKIRSNVTLVNNVTESFYGVKFIFSTLWANIPQHEEKTVRRGISDFMQISNGGHNFMVADFNALHADAVEFIRAELVGPRTGPVVVVTHHVPTFKNYPSHFLGSPLNSAFATDLDDVITKYQPEFWIFGHHHQNMPAFNIGRTVLLTNQLGYVAREEHDGFRQAGIFAVS